MKKMFKTGSIILFYFQVIKDFNKQKVGLMIKDMSQLNQWQEWNTHGFIPGSTETEITFRERITFCQNLEQHLEQKAGADLPFEVGDQKSHHLLQEALPLTQELYGISPHWVLLFFSNYQLTPWHGGCAWIFQLDEHSPTAAFLQLRAHFRTSPTFLGIYYRQELLAHELAHVGRMLYQEPQFEEIFAYQSSSSRWRRWLGPIVQSAKESLFFIILLGIMILANVAFLSVGSHLARVTEWIKLVPTLFIVLALIRLIYRHQTYRRCLKQLETLYQPKIAKHLLYRLRDEEIKQFAHSSPITIKNFIKKAAIHSFRWQFLQTIYPFNDESIL